jgi:hypothetical protein
MARVVITPKEGEELKRLYKEHAEAVAHAAEMLRVHGMESRRFIEADKAAGAKWRRIREILGDADKHGMA